MLGEFGTPKCGVPMADEAVVLRRMRKALKAAGLGETHCFHELRHTFGPEMAAAGVPMRALQEWMGHRDLRRPSAMRTTRYGAATRSSWPPRSVGVTEAQLGAIAAAAV